MNKDEIHISLEAMEFDDLWRLHEQLAEILSVKISLEKLELERRLAQLNRADPGNTAKGFLGTQTDKKPKRKYPKVQPKYLNPSAPEETWSGRGKRPRWLVTALQSGRQLDEFQISESTGTRDEEADHQE
jgi:DNA-binding protein H-NS